MGTPGIPLTWRVLVPTQNREVSLLLDRAFELSSPKSYLDDFPVWDPKLMPAENRHQIGGFHGNRIVSTASIRFAKYRFQDGTEKTLGLIGAVATHPDFGEKGYASEAIELVIHEGERRGVDAYVLWGSESPIYKRRLFAFAGKQIQVPLRALTLPKSTIEGFEFRSGWDVAIAEHLLARKAGILYANSDLLWLSRHKNVEWRTLWLDGKCAAYAAWNRGIDLPNIIHELDGEPAACIALLGLIQARHGYLEWIAHPDRIAGWGLGVRDGIPVEPLAQFRLRTIEAGRVDSMWFSGMDSC